MSVKATTRRGKPVWEVQVIREGGGFNRRRYLDRRSCLKAAALAVEAELIAEYEAMKRSQPGGAGTADVEAAATVSAAPPKKAATKGLGRREAARVGEAEAPRGAAEAKVSAATPTVVVTRRRRIVTGAAASATTSTGAREPERAQAQAPVRGSTSATTPAPARTLAATPVSTRRPTAAAVSTVPTLAEFAERYLALQDPTKSDIRNKTRNLRLHLVPELGALRLDAITSLVIDELRARMRSPTGEVASSRRTLGRQGRREAPASGRRKGGRRSPKTINNVLTTLRSMLHLALDYELIQRVPRIRMEKVEKADPVFLDEDEVERLVAAVPEEWRLFVLTAVRTGLRRGELMGLRWEDLRLEVERPYLRVQRSVKVEEDGRLSEKPPKGGKPRSVPLASDLVAELRRSRPEGAGRGALVFPGPLDGYLDHQRLWKVVTEAGKAAGVDKHVHPHLLRHTFASHCYMQGIPPQVVQAWLGHAHITTTERYAHLAPNAGEDLIDLLVPPAKGATTTAEGCVIRGNTTGNTTRRQKAKNAV